VGVAVGVGFVADLVTPTEVRLEVGPFCEAPPLLRFSSSIQSIVFHLKRQSDAYTAEAYQPTQTKQQEKQLPAAAATTKQLPATKITTTTITVTSINNNSKNNYQQQQQLQQK